MSMRNPKIAVIDSGIGGLSVLKGLVEAYPYCEFLYFGDNDSAPYGSRSKSDLISLTIKNLSFVLSFDVDLLVVACNTLCVSILDEIRGFSPVPVIPIFPPVEREMISGDRVLLLATDVTANRYKGVKNVSAFGLTALVKEIEGVAPFFEKVDIKRFLKKIDGRFDTIILGCTHFLFVKNQIFNHFCPKKIISGEEIVVSSVYILGKSIVKHLRFRVKFIGKSAKKNAYVWSKITP